MKKLVSLTLCLLVAVACNQGQNHNAHNHESHDHEEHTDKKTSVTLNDGERWMANPETNEGIKNMINLVADFDSETGDYEALERSLQSEFADIFKKCTMTGEAHNQLHNYLLPLKEKIDNISDKNIKEILSYLHTYSDYFE